jgi:hypothetical protein
MLIIRPALRTVAPSAPVCPRAVAAHRLTTARLRRLALAVALASALALLTAASAGALVTTVGGQGYGVQPHATTLEASTFNPLSILQYGGGPVMHSNATYAIYWDPAELRPGDPGRPGKYHGDWQQLINQFLYDVGAGSGSLGSVYALTPQYTETGGARAAYSSTFRGGYVDHTTYPADGCTDPEPALNENFACLTDQQLREELKAFIAAHPLKAGLGTIFFVLTPPGVTICTDAGGPGGHCSDSAKADPWHAEAASPSPAETAEQESYERSFCSYHSDTSTAGGETVLYAAIPWVAGTLGSTNLLPEGRSGGDCQSGTETEQEPNQSTLGPDGYYDHGLPDVLINQIAAQQIATITNPLFNGWDEPLGGNEVPDQCRDWFEAPPVVQGSGSSDEKTHAGHFYNQTIGGGSYYLNTEYNQAASYYDYPGLRCELHNNLVASFTPPNPVNAGDLVTFDGNESDVTLAQSADATPTSQPLYRANFSWNFGDGTPVVSGPGYSGPESSTPLYASVVHPYQYGGSYQVTLTVTDAAGNTASVSHPVTVIGPPPPSVAPAGEGSGVAGKGVSAGGVQTGGGLIGPPIPGPVAQAAALSRSLTQVLQRGLAVSYTVNEQVAGRFEVLLDKRTAKRLKVGGPTATALPAGTPPSLLIGRALVITTKGGRSMLRIKFSSATVARLRHVRRLTLTLRLVVHNAASHSPQSTTVISTVVLHH